MEESGRRVFWEELCEGKQTRGKSLAACAAAERLERIQILKLPNLGCMASICSA
jgi:hypothetical protein